LKCHPEYPKPPVLHEPEVAAEKNLDYVAAPWVEGDLYAQLGFAEHVEVLVIIHFCPCRSESSEIAPGGPRTKVATAT
jgi:hypothetical protein